MDKGSIGLKSNSVLSSHSVESIWILLVLRTSEDIHLVLRGFSVHDLLCKLYSLDISFDAHN
jgi:hypothetical protein